MKGIDLLSGAGYKIHLMAVLSRANFQVIPEFFDLAARLKAHRMNFTRLIAISAGKAYSQKEENRTLSPAELRNAFLTIMAESSRTSVRTKVHSPLMALIEPSLGRSGRFWEALVIDYKGNYLISSRSRIQIGHVDGISMEDVLVRNPYFRPLVAKKVDQCGKCEFYEQCGGDRNAAYAESGDFLGKDPGCWKIADSL
jgi:MoaA/NifB/PqqE/SkfB family radical SAM enzyme